MGAWGEGGEFDELSRLRGLPVGQIRVGAADTSPIGWGAEELVALGFAVPLVGITYRLGIRPREPGKPRWQTILHGQDDPIGADDKELDEEEKVDMLVKDVKACASQGMA